MARRRRSRKSSSTKVSCASTYKGFMKKNLSKMIKKTGDAKKAMRALAKEWKECK